MNTLSEAQKNLVFAVAGFTQKKVERMFRDACEDDDTDIIYAILELGILEHRPRNDFYLIKLMRMAAIGGEIKFIKYLVDIGCDVHGGNENILMLAAYYGHLDIVRYLVEEQGAEVSKIADTTAYCNAPEVHAYFLERKKNEVHVHAPLC
jgi:hypothetical protein